MNGIGRLIVAGAAFIALAGPSQPHAAFSGSNGKVVFERDGTLEPELQLIDPVAGPPSALFAGADPAWSPDGTKVAYTRGFREDIYVRNADGSGAELRLTTDPGRDIQPAWSPDGTRITFASAQDRIGIEGGLDLWAVDVGSGALQRLTSNLGGDWQTWQPAWSPDGTTIAFTLHHELWTIPAPVANGPDPYPIVPRNPDETALPDPNATRLSAVCVADGPCDFKRYSSPSWSPDGTRIAFLANDTSTHPSSTSWRAYVMDANGQNVRLLADNAIHPGAIHVASGGTEAPAWSPDGIQIAYTAAGADGTNLWIVDSAGSTPPRQLTAAVGNEHDPDWQTLPANTPAGTNISFGPSNGVSLTFDEVTSAGMTSVTKSSSGPATPAGFSLGDPPTYYDISTTAVFTGTVRVCIDTTGIMFSGTPVLMHFENSAWVEVTLTPVSLPIVCGRVSSLSPFAVFVASANNRPPSTPGTPAGRPNPNEGAFRLDWLASFDPDGDSVTYTLEHRDADDPGFSLVAAGLTDTVYLFLPRESEGTWMYRVRSTDGKEDSGFSPESAPVKVDQSFPFKPTVAPSRAPDYTGGGGWYRDSVSVTTTSNGDRVLADGSPGSGVTFVSEPATVSLSGAHEVIGEVRDAVGFGAIDSTLVQVDADAPTVTLLCPPDPVLLGASIGASWTASDAHSGLATAAEGAIALDTSTVGSKTVTTPVARDNVGHEATASCTYQVVHDFAGFFQPVDNLPTLNSVNAGRAIPIKFSLGGNHGLDVLAAGYPRSEAIACDSNAAVDGIEETLTAGSSSLSYDAASGQYVYAWKTESAWAGTCRQLVVKLNDGTYHRANFKFK